MREKWVVTKAFQSSIQPLNVCFVPSLLTFIINYLPRLGSRVNVSQDDAAPHQILGVMSTWKQSSEAGLRIHISLFKPCNQNTISWPWDSPDAFLILNEAEAAEQEDVTCHIFWASSSGEYKTVPVWYFPTSLFTQGLEPPPYYVKCPRLALFFREYQSAFTEKPNVSHQMTPIGIQRLVCTTCTH